MRRTQIGASLYFCALLALAACGGEVTGLPGQPAAEQTPHLSIWQAPSPSIDPTALPLHDHTYVTSSAQKGLVYVCDPLAFQQVNGPGATAQGDWIDTQRGTFDITGKVSVQGTVYFNDAWFRATPDGDRRVIQGNGLPVGVPTGTFPVQTTDPAYQYDRNPNAITAQTYDFSIPLNPVVSATTSCAYNRVGITLDGIPLELPIDSSGRDELAYEVQDSGTGGSEPGGSYHRHALSDVTPHIHERNALVGYALDGFGIFSPYDADGNELTSDDLDECHGMTSEIEWDGRKVSMYHYVLTRDFPYMVACFRGKPTRNALPPLPGAPLEQDSPTPAPPPPPSGGDGHPGGTCMPTPGQGPATPPPPEAFTACQGKTVHSSCSFAGPSGAQLAGVCVGPPDNPNGTPLACLPCP